MQLFGLTNSTVCQGMKASLSRRYCQLWRKPFRRLKGSTSFRQTSAVTTFGDLVVIILKAEPMSRRTNELLCAASLPDHPSKYERHDIRGLGKRRKDW